MTDAFLMTTRNDAGHWSEALRSVAVVHEPALVELAGAPHRIAKDSAAFATFVRDYLRDRQARHPDFPSFEDYAQARGASAEEIEGFLKANRRQEVSATMSQMYQMWEEETTRLYTAYHAGVLGGLLTKLATVYGESDVQALISWAERHFVDRAERTRWRAWDGALRRLSIAWNEHAIGEALPSSGGVRHLTQIMREWFDQESVEREEALERAAREHPLSPLDRELLHGQVSPAVEEARDRAITSLELAVGRERAFRFVTEVMRTVRPRARKDFVSWMERAGETVTPEMRASLEAESLDPPPD